MKKNNEKGFSLVELLVVVIIIAIVAAIAIPNLLASRRAANEASAVASLRTIHSAEATYYATQVSPTYGTLAALNTAGLIDANFAGASATKSGYNFTSSATALVYCAAAAPSTPASTGTNYFGVGSTNGGVVMKDTTAISCASGNLGATGSPIQ